jgi:hypothetical protein
MFVTPVYDSLHELPAFCEQSAVAKLLRKSVRTIRRAAAEGLITPIRLSGSCTVYSRSDILRLYGTKNWAVRQKKRRQRFNLERHQQFKNFIYERSDKDSCEATDY